MPPNGQNIQDEARKGARSKNRRTKKPTVDFPAEIIQWAENLIREKGNKLRKVLYSPCRKFVLKNRNKGLVIDVRPRYGRAIPTLIFPLVDKKPRQYSKPEVWLQPKAGKLTYEEFENIPDKEEKYGIDAHSKNLGRYKGKIVAFDW